MRCNTNQGLQGLRFIGRFTDQIWPLPDGDRDLGGQRNKIQRIYHLGSRLYLAIKPERAGHLLVLDEGTTGNIYCLCPSGFARNTRVDPEHGWIYLPQVDSPCPSFEISGVPGREHVLAILTYDPLGLDWLPNDPETPARILSASDLDTLLGRLRSLEGNQWTAWSTYFDVIP